MIATPEVYERFLLDLVGGIMFAHRIDPWHIAAVLRIDDASAAALIAESHHPPPLDLEQSKRLKRFANFLTRLELRAPFSAEMRRAISVQITSLGGRSPAQMFGGTMEDLLLLREAVNAVDIPKIRWWRGGAQLNTGPASSRAHIEMSSRQLCAP